MAKKYVYAFGGGQADGEGSMRELLGGKGANLAEMAGHPELRLPVPPGFTVTTEVCSYFYEHGREYPKGLDRQVARALRTMERLMGRTFGDPQNPLLVSVRSGARASMPGMMETVLNVGLTSETIPGLVALAGGDERFVYDAYRRLITMYADVVMEKAAGIATEDGHGIRVQLDRLLHARKQRMGVINDNELPAEALKELCSEMKDRVTQVLSKPFPNDANEQLWGGITAVFASWNGKRAVSYRRIEGIPDEWGTAVNIQAMVFGNLGEASATGVAFTRDPGSGAKTFYGEYLVNAQGEDVVAGIRTPAPINEESKSEHNRDLVSLQERMPKVYRELHRYQARLERHYRDMQDIEFTIESGKLYMLQCRVGKRNGPAAVRMAVEMAKERLISAGEAITRVSPAQLDELLHPILDPTAEATASVLARGLPAGPGGACGQLAFSADEAVRETAAGRAVILVREETNPEDIEGMRAANAILTARGGMTSHAALVARGWGKCCIVGCSELQIDAASRTLTIADKTLGPADWISLNGTAGVVYEGKLAMITSGENLFLFDFLKLCDKLRRLGVRANADTPEDASRARAFGAEGIGLFRTEHMFYGEEAERPLQLLRHMILAPDTERRQLALDQLFTFLKTDFKETLAAMRGYPVTIRLLDPPLHEFVPHDAVRLAELAHELDLEKEHLQERIDHLRESNPMMGHRGVRLGTTYPEITRTQARAIFEAAAELAREGTKATPEIMVPFVVSDAEMALQFELIRQVHGEVCEALGVRRITHQLGTMIEIPRAALVADRLAESAEFFSFGTNDLTQMTLGFSRDDIGAFLPEYLERALLPADPFQTLDIDGVGELVRLAVERGRARRRNLKVGICGEHGGDPASVRFCHRVGMDYVSCSPYRIPIAKLAAAQAVVEEEKAAPPSATRKKVSRKKAAGRKKAPVRRKATVREQALAVRKKGVGKKKATTKKVTLGKKAAARKKATARKKRVAA